jgi:hypothetical protein
MSNKDDKGYEVTFWQKVLIGILVTAFFVMTGFLVVKFLEYSKINKSTGLSSQYSAAYPNLAQKINSMSLKCKGYLPLLGKNKYWNK